MYNNNIIYYYYNNNNKMNKKNYLKMSIKELYQESKKYDSNISKKNIIKQIIENKIKLEKIENEHRKNIKERLSKTINDNDDNKTNILLEELLNLNDEKISLPENDNHHQNNVNFINNNVDNINIDKKFKEEIDKDYKNNKLMERLNSELIFRNNTEKSKMFNNLEKPYLSNQNMFDSFNSSNQIATINDKEAFGLPSTDFTSQGILKKKF